MNVKMTFIQAEAILDLVPSSVYDESLIPMLKKLSKSYPEIFEFSEGQIFINITIGEQFFKAKKYNFLATEELYSLKSFVTKTKESKLAEEHKMGLELSMTEKEYSSLMMKIEGLNKLNKAIENQSFGNLGHLSFDLLVTEHIMEQLSL